MKALPKDKEGLKAAEDLKPDDDDLEPDEIYAIMDSGSGVHGGRKGVHFKGYKVQPNRASRNGHTCIAACGTIMKRRGECRVNAEIGGEVHRINFDDIDIDTPVLSVRKIVRNGNHVRMQRGGGYIKNKKTGKRLYVVEKQGVYFIKLKILEPDQEDVNLEEVFARQG